MDARGAAEFNIAAAAKLRVPLYGQITLTLVYMLCYTSAKLFFYFNELGSHGEHLFLLAGAG